jgi:hypothetical protein
MTPASEKEYVRDFPFAARALLLELIDSACTF